MSVLGVVLLVLAVLVVVLFLGGYVANARRRSAEAAALHARAQEADRHLAIAQAEDRGWERSGLEQAARDAYAQRSGGRVPQRLTLVEVIDKPGTKADQAVFDADGERLVLGRREGVWRPV